MVSYYRAVIALLVFVGIINLEKDMKTQRILKLLFSFAHVSALF